MSALGEAVASVSLDGWQAVGGGVVSLALGAYAAWQARGAKKSAKATHHQVTVNGGKSDPPTMPDRMRLTEDRLTEKLDALATTVEGLARAQAKTHDLMVEHLSDHAGSDLSAPAPQLAAVHPVKAIKVRRNR